MERIWEARKQFDVDVEREFGDVAFDDTKATPIRRAIQDMRRGVNDFIADEIGDDTFKQQMQTLSDLYEARYRMAENNYKLLNSNKFKRWALENPGQVKLLKVLIGSGVVGAVGSQIIQ